MPAEAEAVCMLSALERVLYEHLLGVTAVAAVDPYRQRSRQ